MGKRFVLFIGLLVYVFFIFESNVCALSFNVLTYDVALQPDSVAIEDFNGDGNPDLAVANGGSNTVSILLGKVDGTFQTAVNYSVGSDPLSVAVKDFNGDGNPDLAVANGGGNTVSILLGKVDGTFQAAVNYSVGNNPSAVAVEDFNRDGNPDLAVANGGGNTVSILLGKVDGTFQAAVNYSVGSNPSAVAVEDFNRDGKPDLAVANGGSNTVSILLGNIDGTFQTATDSSVNDPQSVAVGDFNVDGKPDLAVANSAINSVSILLGNGDGTFQTATNFSVGSNPLAVAVEDFNGDGKPDLAVANSAGNTVSILLNTLVTVPGAPTGVTAKAGNAQATVSFSAPASNGGSPIISYTVTSSPEKITATGTSSPITVTGLTNGTVYTFTVTATNAIGTGPASAPSNSVRWGPIISVGPMSVNFGSVRVGGISSPKTVTIKNTGNDDLIITSISMTGVNQSEFIQTNNCSTVLAQSSCAISVTFAPAIPFGKKSAVLSISSSDTKKPTVNVKLLGQAAPPKISAAPQSVNFGSAKIGSISTPKVVIIKNTGMSDLIMNSITVTGANAAEFNEENDCSAIVKGSSCAVTVTFSPASTGKKNAIIAISSNDPKKPTVNVKLSGQGAPSKISAAPQSVNFGSIQVGNISTPKVVTVKNTGISDLVINSITVTGTNAAEFIQENDCSTIAKGSSCAITVTFSPASTGNKNAIIGISSNDPKKPTLSVYLSGKGRI